MIPDELRAALAEVTRAKAQRAGLGNLSKSIEEITGEPRTCSAHGDFEPCPECKRIRDRREP